MKTERGKDEKLFTVMKIHMPCQLPSVCLRSSRDLLQVVLSLRLGGASGAWAILMQKELVLWVLQ